MNNKNIIKITIFGVVSLGTLLIHVFLWLLSVNEPEHLRAVYDKYLTIFFTFNLFSFFIFFFGFDIYDSYGKAERDQIIIFVISILSITQIAFTFAYFANYELDFSVKSRDKANKIYHELNEPTENIYNKILFTQKMNVDPPEKAIDVLIKSTFILKSQKVIKLDQAKIQEVQKLLQYYKNLYPELIRIDIYDKRGDFLVSSQARLSKKEMENKDNLVYYSFPFSKFELKVFISNTESKNFLYGVLKKLIVTLIISVFFMIELIIFTLQYIGNKINPLREVKGEKPCTALVYIRSISFMFYFSSQITVTFIPLMALEFNDNFFGLSKNIMASIPLSMEIFISSLSIFFISGFIQKKGWKVPFLGGLFFVIFGNLLSAFSNNIFMFIFSRIMVGFGYGFCWMTLRNLSLFGRTGQEKSSGFSLLNAGFYAGIICGAVFGAILASVFSFKIILFISAFFSLLTSFFVLIMENKVYKPFKIIKKIKYKKIIKLPKSQLISLLFLILLIILPSSIVSAYLGYYIPIYFNELGKPISDIGIAHLLYGLVLIFIGSNIVKLHKLKNWTYLYSVLLGLAFLSYGLIGGYDFAMGTVFILAVADSFGLVSQNNYYVKLKINKVFGKNLSRIIFIYVKKLGQAIGPIIFALSMGFGLYGIAAIGLIFIIFLACYIIIFDKYIKFNSK